MKKAPSDLPPPTLRQRIVGWITIGCWVVGIPIVIYARAESRANRDDAWSILSIGLALVIGPIFWAYVSAKYRARRDPVFAERLDALLAKDEEQRPARLRALWRRAGIKIAVALVALVVVIIYSAIKR